MNTMTCPKCFGKGEFPTLRHIDDGICYGCDGTGEIEVSGEPLRAIEPVRMTREKYIMSLKEQLNSARFAMKYGEIWGADEDESGMGPRAFAWLCANAPVDVARRAEAALDRINVQAAA